MVNLSNFDEVLDEKVNETIVNDFTYDYGWDREANEAFLADIFNYKTKFVAGHSATKTEGVTGHTETKTEFVAVGAK